MHISNKRANAKAVTYLLPVCLAAKFLGVPTLAKYDAEQTDFSGSYSSSASRSILIHSNVARELQYKADKFDLSAKSLFAKSLSVKLSRCNLSIFKMSVCKMSASKKNPWHHKTQKGAGDIKVRWQIGSMKIRDNFFTRVLIYLLPGVCIYSLEHLEDFCWIRFSSLKAKVSEI